MRAQDTITREQADTLIKEIRELRRAIDGLRAPAPRAGGERPPDEKVRVDIAGAQVLGRADAPVTLVEFTDLECPYCRAFHVGAFERLKREYIDTGKVRFVSRDFPLDFHPNARPAALAVRCAGEQGKFWEMRHAVTLNAAALGAAVYDRLAAELGIDAARFSACIAADRYRADIDRDMAEATEGRRERHAQLRPRPHHARHRGRGAADRRRPALPGLRVPHQGPARRALTARRQPPRSQRRRNGKIVFWTESTWRST